MKKRFFAMCLTLLCLVGCGKTIGNQGNSLDFYYQKTNATLGAEMGILDIQDWYYQGETPTFQTILDAYLSGPTQDGFINPFPSGLTVESVGLDKSVLTVQFNSAYDTVSGYEKTIMDCCLTNTLTQFPAVNFVVFETKQSKNTENFTAQARSTADYVLMDKGVEITETTVRVYHSDVNGRYLLSQDVEVTIEDHETVPQIVIEQLIAGPTDGGQYNALPEGAELLGISVNEEGLCTVNFSAEFIYNRPTTELMERITVFSVVNSLTELKTIDEVLILSEGEAIGQYLYMDLSEPLVRDENILTLVRVDQGEADATIYVKGATEEHLSAIPVGLFAMNENDLPERLMVKLLQFEAVNGYEKPLPAGVALQKIVVTNGICYLDFNDVFLQWAGDSEGEFATVCSIVYSLTSLNSIQDVVITVNDTVPDFEYYNLLYPLNRNNT
ncbi:MAG: GerMN domain-containing protein [Eubacteriales bacterium]